MNKPPQPPAASYLPSRAFWTGVFLILVSSAAIAASAPTFSTLFAGGVGLGVAVLGIIAVRRVQNRSIAVNLALGISLLAVLISLRGLSDFILLLRGGSVAHPVDTLTQATTLLINLIFVLRGYAARA